MAKVMNKELKAMFNGAETLGELKYAYAVATLKYQTGKIREIANGWYIDRFEELKNKEHDKTGKVYEWENAELCSHFLNAAQVLRGFGDDVEVSRDRGWIWITGDTKPHKDELKSAGARYFPNRQAWAFMPQRVY